MTIRMFACEWCGQEWTSPISAALCCDETSMSLDDEWRGYD